MMHIHIFAIGEQRSERRKKILRRTINPLIGVVQTIRNEYGMQQQQQSQQQQQPNLIQQKRGKSIISEQNL